MKVQVCPYCHEANVSLNLGGYAGITYRCGSCGYVGPLVIEMSPEEYQKMIKAEKREQKGEDQESADK